MARFLKKGKFSKFYNRRVGLPDKATGNIDIEVTLPELQVTKLHGIEQGFVEVTPAVVQDHSVLRLPILVDAISPHNPILVLELQ